MTDEIETPIRQLRYQMTRADIAAFEHLPGELIGLQILWLVLPIFLCGMAAGLFEEELRTLLPWDISTDFGSFVEKLLIVAVGFGLSTLALTLRDRWSIRQAKLPNAETEITVYPSRYSVATGLETRTFAWRDVTVASNDTHVFLMNAPREVTIVPLRAFKDAADMQSFATYADIMGDDEDIVDDSEKEPVKAKS